MNGLISQNANFWTKKPHGLTEHWVGSRMSFLKITERLMDAANEDGEVHFSGRALAQFCGIHVSNVSRFLSKGALRGLWIYKFNPELNKSFLRFVGGPFLNVFKRAQHLANKTKEYFKRSNPWKGVSRNFNNATPAQHQTQHHTDPLKRSRTMGLIAQIRERSLANATPLATEI